METEYATDKKISRMMSKLRIRGLADDDDVEKFLSEVGDSYVGLVNLRAFGIKSFTLFELKFNDMIKKYSRETNIEFFDLIDIMERIKESKIEKH